MARGTEPRAFALAYSPLLMCLPQAAHSYTAVPSNAMLTSLPCVWRQNSRLKNASMVSFLGE